VPDVHQPNLDDHDDCHANAPIAAKPRRGFGEILLEVVLR
jgi:hypothetical protein